MTRFIFILDEYPMCGSFAAYYLTCGNILLYYFCSLKTVFYYEYRDIALSFVFENFCHEFCAK